VKVPQETEILADFVRLPIKNTLVFRSDMHAGPNKFARLSLPAREFHTNSRLDLRPET
jgi:hypothetical protein